MEKPEQWVADANSFFNGTNYMALQKRWDIDYDLYNLAPYNAGKGFYSFTTNRPRIVVNKGVSILTDAKLVVRVPDEGFLPSDDREIANNIERFCYGVLNLMDDRNSKIPNMPSLRQQMAWFACMRGAIAVCVLVYKDGSGKTVVSIVPWDIYNVAFWVDDLGICKAIHRRIATKEEVKSLYNYTSSTKQTTLYDCWDNKDNGVICEGNWVKQPNPHGHDCCPVFIISAGALPQASRTGVIDTGVYQGESILAENRNIYPMINKTMSDYLTLVRRGVMVPMGIWSSGGTKTMDINIWQVEDGAFVPMDSDRNEKIEPLIKETMPADAAPMMSFLRDEEERGGFSPLALGMIDLNSRMSGYAINNLQSATATRVIPFIECLNRAYKVVMLSAIQQYVSKPWAPIKVWGRTSKNQVFGVPMPVQIAPKDISDKYNIEITLVPVFPKDDAQRYELARLATQGDKPLISVKSAQEDILGLEDTDLEGEHIANEWSDALPLIRLLKAYKAALADKDEMRADTVLAEVKRVMAELMGQAGQPAEGANPVAAKANAPQAMFQENPGMGIPSGATGLRPQTMPPEILGGASAGMANAKGA